MSGAAVDRPEDSPKIKTKGRGHRRRGDDDENARYGGRGGVFDQVSQNNGGPAKSVEGYIIFVTNVHEEAQEDDLMDKFSDFGDIKNIHVNLDRRSGFVKGYALIEFEQQSEAAEAIRKMNGKKLLDKTVGVDWAFTPK